MPLPSPSTVTRVVQRKSSGNDDGSNSNEAPLLRQTVAERLIAGKTYNALLAETVAAAEADRLTVYHTIASDDDSAYVMARVRDHNLRVKPRDGFETFLQTLPRELTFFGSDGGCYVPSLCSGQCWDDCLLSVFWMAGVPAERYFAADLEMVPVPFERDATQRHLVVVVHHGVDTTATTASMTPVTAFIEHTSVRVPLTHRCAACGMVVDGRLRCGSCRVVRYCDRDCQRQHWRTHRKNC